MITVFFVFQSKKKLREFVLYYKGINIFFVTKQPVDTSFAQALSAPRIWFINDSYLSSCTLQLELAPNHVDAEE
uniref:Uncharacterized protein n=1 Tax=Trichoplusia ni single nucleopolyhedrovirus TaxID=332054 RepID=A0A481V9W5_9ABAC|nr:hypothetical protein [Trichoplusia ni single nucleopolyhedrovirus]